MLFQTCVSFLLMLNTKEDILKNAGNRTVDGPHWPISFPTVWFVKIPHNIFFCVQHN